MIQDKFGVASRCSSDWSLLFDEGEHGDGSPDSDGIRRTVPVFILYACVVKFGVVTIFPFFFLLKRSLISSFIV